MDIYDISNPNTSTIKKFSTKFQEINESNEYLMFILPNYIKIWRCLLDNDGSGNIARYYNKKI